MWIKIRKLFARNERVITIDNPTFTLKHEFIVTRDPKEDKLIGITSFTRFENDNIEIKKKK